MAWRGVGVGVCGTHRQVTNSGRWTQTGGGPRKAPFGLRAHPAAAPDTFLRQWARRPLVAARHFSCKARPAYPSGLGADVRALPAATQKLGNTANPSAPSRRPSGSTNNRFRKKYRIARTQLSAPSRQPGHLTDIDTMLVSHVGLGLRACRPTLTTTSSYLKTVPASSRSISHILTSSSRLSCASRNPPPATASGSASSFFTPSLCRIRRHASTTASPSAAQQILDWNSFFRLRTSRRRYSLASSIISAIATTGATFVFLSTQPELADQITKLIPTDPFVSMGILTFGATLLGWLIGPMFGNTVWSLFHRSRLPEFTIKERAFFERIKRHRVNPVGASTNNPVPDYYGEKIGSVSGYRRWLKDQRAFNRKREGTYTARV